MELLRSEMKEEIRSLKQRLTKCERQNKELYKRLKDPDASNLDSPRGGFGSNYETNVQATKTMKPREITT